jgi:regulator of sigma E protease
VVLRITQTASDTELVVTVDRGGNLTELVATPRRRDVVTTFGTTRVGILGVQSKPEYWHIQHYNLVDSFKLAGLEFRLCPATLDSYLTKISDHRIGSSHC